MGYTSSAVKQKYNSKTYTQMVIHVRKEKAQEFKTKCQEMGIPYSKVFHEAIDRFLEDNGGANENN